MVYGVLLYAAVDTPPKVVNAAVVAVSLFFRPDALNSEPANVMVSP